LDLLKAKFPIITVVKYVDDLALRRVHTLKQTMHIMPAATGYLISILEKVFWKISSEALEERAST